MDEREGFRLVDALREVVLHGADSPLVMIANERAFTSLLEGLLTGDERTAYDIGRVLIAVDRLANHVAASEGRALAEVLDAALADTGGDGEIPTGDATA